MPEYFNRQKLVPGPQTAKANTGGEPKCLHVYVEGGAPVCLKCAEPLTRQQTIQLQQEHQHQFTIPVEWQYTHGTSMGGYAWPETMFVTKLRCVCGEEVYRG